MRYKSSTKKMKQFIYPEGFRTNQKELDAATLASVIPSQKEVAIVPTKQPKAVSLSGKYTLVGKSGKPFNGMIELKDGNVLLSYNGKVVNTKIANGTFLTNEGDQIRIFKSRVTGFMTKSELDAQSEPKIKPAAKRRQTNKKQFIELLEENKKLLVLLADKFGNQKA